MDDESNKQGFLERLFHRVTSDAPESSEEVLRLLRRARETRVLSADTTELLGKVMAFSELEVRDVMISRAQMKVIKLDDPAHRIIDYILENTHSRFPVIEGDRDEIAGILHTKDLLRYFNRPEEMNLRELLREAIFVPESKSLPLMLKEFREKHLHLAMVVDEYGGVSGLVTFEDVLEAILGDIEDEFDIAEDDDLSIVEVGDNRYRVNALTEIAEFNEFFGVSLTSEDVNTVGGFVTETMGRLPARGEKIEIEGLRLTVAHVDRRRVYSLIVQKTDRDETETPNREPERP